MGGGIALPLGGEGSAGLLDYVRASPGDRAIQVRLEQGRWVDWSRARPVRVHVQAAAETTICSLGVDMKIRQTMFFIGDTHFLPVARYWKSPPKTCACSPPPTGFKNFTSFPCSMKGKA